jgi:hypothetical protein
MGGRRLAARPFSRLPVALGDEGAASKRGARPG